MGQYYLVVNKDKKEYLDPHKFGSGLKLMEFSGDGESVMQGLAVLLADGNGRGGGDLESSSSLVGSWAGDRIVVAGDYADEGKFTEGEIDQKGDKYNLYFLADKEYKDISNAIIRVIVEAEGEFSRMARLLEEGHAHA